MNLLIKYFGPSPSSVNEIWNTNNINLKKNMQQVYRMKWEYKKYKPMGKKRKNNILCEREQSTTVIHQIQAAFTYVYRFHILPVRTECKIFVQNFAAKHIVYIYRWMHTTCMWINGTVILWKVLLKSRFILQMYHQHWSVAS